MRGGLLVVAGGAGLAPGSYGFSLAGKPGAQLTGKKVFATIFEVWPRVTLLAGR
jgi:hypothetical protein